MARARAQNRIDYEVTEELHFRTDNAFLCLLLNRRARLIRVIDFRAGALPAKRLFIQSIAQRERIEKVITLVEKDEVSSWTRVGFVREGQIPGFYKRSDGHLLGCVIGTRAGSEASEEGAKVTERTINAAKKLSKELDQSLKGVSLRVVPEEVAFDARDKVWAQGKGIGCFDPFGRGVERLFLEVSCKRTEQNYLSAEYQLCFGHSLLEVLRSPRSATEVLAVAAGLHAFAEELKKRGIVSAFAFGPNEDIALSTAYLTAGFRKTGFLAKGLQLGNQRADAILWTRKLANPGEEDEEFA